MGLGEGSNAMSYGITVIAAVGLAVLPGAWLGFTVPDRRVPWQVKLAFSVCFPPLCWPSKSSCSALAGNRSPLPYTSSVY